MGRGIRSEEAREVEQGKKEKLRCVFFFGRGERELRVLMAGFSLAADRRRMRAGFRAAIKSL